MRLHQPHFRRSHDPWPDGRVDIDGVPIHISGTEDDDFVGLIVAVAGIDPDSYREGLAHAHIEALGGGSATFGDVPEHGGGV